MQATSYEVMEIKAVIPNADKNVKGSVGQVQRTEAAQQQRGKKKIIK